VSADVSANGQYDSLMNGEHRPEYVALLASEGLLGHQHANSGWGTFDEALGAGE
jgi:xylose isomerase